VTRAASFYSSGNDTCVHLFHLLEFDSGGNEDRNSFEKEAEMTRKFLSILIPFSLILVFGPPAGAQTVSIKPNSRIVDLAAVWSAPKESTNRELIDAGRLSVILELRSRYGKECWHDSLPKIETHVDWNATQEFHKKGGQDYVLISKEDTIGWNHRDQTLQGFIEFLRKQK
jgi:hypothetical protein